MKEFVRKYIKISKKSIPWLLLGLGLITRFAFFGWPSSAVFDEVHFGKFISAYFTHQYYFDIHPPLGKLVLAAWGWLWGFRPGFSFANIGDIYPDHLYLALRFLPSLAGALLPLVIYGIALQLGLRHRWAFFAGILVALDNALIAQSRFILLDSFLLLFGFGAVWCYLKARSEGRATRSAWRWLLTAGVLAGAAASIKWTGLTFLALIGVMETITLWKNRPVTARLLISRLSFLVLIPLILYVSVFAVHFSLLYKSGTGDAFMTREFQHDLAGNPAAGDSSIRPLSLGDKFVQINQEMYRSNQRLTANHPYSSKWYTWPLMARPVYYWNKGPGEGSPGGTSGGIASARIYLLGNPVIWWAATVAVLALLANALLSGLKRLDRTAMILGGAWLVNMLPFIGISRIMFLYHYLTALVWAILLLAYLAGQQNWTRRATIGFVLLVAAIFAFFSPLTYGLPLSEAAYNARVWFNSWR